MLLLRRSDGSVWLQRRPSTGIWGGLWSPPEFPDTGAAREAAPTNDATSIRALPAIEHVFTHFDLTIEPLLVDVAAAGVPATPRIAEAAEGVWYNARAPQKVGLPAPVAALLASLVDA